MSEELCVTRGKRFPIFNKNRSFLLQQAVNTSPLIDIQGISPKVFSHIIEH